MILIDWWLSQLILSLNWLSITIPFIASGSIVLGESKIPKPVRPILALACFAAIIALYYGMYRATGFPSWIRWFA